MVGACLYLYTCLTFNLIYPPPQYYNSLWSQPLHTLTLCFLCCLLLLTTVLSPPINYTPTRSTTASFLPHHTAFHYSCLSSHCYCFCSSYYFTYHQATPNSCSRIALCAPSLLLTSCLTTPMHTVTFPDTSSPWLWQKLKYGRITPIIFCFTSVKIPRHVEI